MAEAFPSVQNHVFLGEGHERNERRTWTVIALCSFMMVAEIVGGLLFGSIALVADGPQRRPHRPETRGRRQHLRRRASRRARASRPRHRSSAART